jgi:hypothetical protein
MDDYELEAAALRREADRCERLSLGLSNPVIIAKLRAWAVEYRRHADLLLRVKKAA